MNANSKSIPKAENIRVHSRSFAVSESLVDRILAAKQRDAGADTSALEPESDSPVLKSVNRRLDEPLLMARTENGLRPAATILAWVANSAGLAESLN